MSEFARRWYAQAHFARLSYRGVECWTYPADLAAYQTMIGDLAPLLVVELGTFHGGSALFMADCMDAADAGHVVTIDCADYPDAPGPVRPGHKRVTYVRGRTDEQPVVDAVRIAVHRWEGHVAVVHDADHSGPQVLADLQTYAPLVTPGSWLGVCDTNLDHPDDAVFADGAWGPGPWWALSRFLADEPRGRWEWSRGQPQTPLMTCMPDGWVRRLKP